MHEFVGSLVRRGVRDCHALVMDGGKVEPPKMPGWGLAVVYGTLLLFALTLGLVDYTLNDVLGTLTMIESPATAMVIPSTPEEADKKDGLLSSPEIVPMKPITSKIRTTIQHITSIGGRLARWRGMVPAMLYAMACASVFSLFEMIIPQSIPARDTLATAAGSVLLARFHMGWTHAVISMPSNTRWYQRLAPRGCVKQLWVPTVVNVVSVHAVTYLVAGLAILMHQSNQSLMGDEGQHIPKFMWAVLIVEGLALGGFAISMGLFVVLPAAVTLARIEASMLPDDQDTIVPFDRSFGGKVVPRVLGGSGAIGFLDAWRTFNWDSRKRLIKLYAKNILIMTALVFTMVHLVAFEIWAILGPRLGEYLVAWKQHHVETYGF